MNTPRRNYVLNLPDWELPRLGDLEWPLVERLADAARVRRLGSESLEDAIYEVVHGSLTQLAETAVNETIEYWLRGLGDGNDGRWPELCVEFPYLERRETAEPLTLVYHVDNADGSRTQLNRTSLDDVVARVLEDAVPPASITGRARIVALALRRLADRLERCSLGGAEAAAYSSGGQRTRGDGSKVAIRPVFAAITARQSPQDRGAQEGSSHGAITSDVLGLEVVMHSGQSSSLSQSHSSFHSYPQFGQQ